MVHHSHGNSITMVNLIDTLLNHSNYVVYFILWLPVFLYFVRINLVTAL